MKLSSNDNAKGRRDMKHTSWQFIVYAAIVAGAVLAIGRYQQQIGDIVPRLASVESSVIDARAEREQLRGLLHTMNARQEARQEELLRRFDRLERMP